MSIYDPLTCSHCGTSNDWLAAFCATCGNQLKPNPSKRNPLLLFGLIGICGCALWLAVIITSQKESRSSNLNAVRSTPTPSVPTPSVPTPTPKVSSAEKLDRAKRMTGGNPSSQEMFNAVKLLKEIPKGERETKEALALEETITEKLARNMAEEILLGAKPENSAWDGSVRCVDRYLKDVLNDYDDSEYLEWSPVAKIYLKKEPYWAVGLKLRARNAFGAKIVKQVVFLIRNNQVVSAEGL